MTGEYLNGSSNPLEVDLSRYETYIWPQIEPGQSIALIGPSSSGKTTFLLRLIQQFPRLSSLSLEKCRMVAIAMKEPQELYTDIFNLFPKSTKKIMETTVPQSWLSRDFWLSDDPSEWNLVILDDQIEELSKKQSTCIDFLSGLSSIGSHHWRCVTATLVQSAGERDTSARLRSILRSTPLFFLFPGLSVTTLRWLAGFLAPGEAKFFVTIFQMLQRKKGEVILADQRLETPLQFRFLYGRVATDYDEFMIAFTPS